MAVGGCGSLKMTSLILGLLMLAIIIVLIGMWIHNNKNNGIAAMFGFGSLGGGLSGLGMGGNINSGAPLGGGLIGGPLGGGKLGGPLGGPSLGLSPGVGGGLVSINGPYGAVL